MGKIAKAAFADGLRFEKSTRCGNTLMEYNTTEEYT